MHSFQHKSGECLPKKEKVIIGRKGGGIDLGAPKLWPVRSCSPAPLQLIVLKVYLEFILLTCLYICEKCMGALFKIFFDTKLLNFSIDTIKQN
jgi:hypothetical protein